MFDRVLACCDVCPERIQIRCAGELARHTNDRNAFQAILIFRMTHETAFLATLLLSLILRRKPRSGIRDRSAQPFRERAHRCVSKEFRDGNLSVESLLQSGVYRYQQQRVSADVEEVVIQTDVIRAQHLPPRAGHFLFQICASGCNAGASRSCHRRR